MCAALPTSWGSKQGSVPGLLAVLHVSGHASETRPLQLTQITDENDEMVEIKLEISGTWKIENGYIKSIAEKVKSDPETPAEAQKEIITGINKTNSADKIIELNDQKLITENADGERKTWKRRVQ
jgi:hypothetical protein